MDVITKLRMGYWVSGSLFFFKRERERERERTKLVVSELDESRKDSTGIRKNAALNSS